MFQWFRVIIYNIEQTKAYNAISLRIEESLKIEVGNRIDFENAILKKENQPKGKPKLYYICSKYKKKGFYDILTDISKYVTLLQLINS